MSDEESMSEGFSASEDEWKPTKNLKGESSDEDDDDSDYEEAPTKNAGKAASLNTKKTTKGKGVANKTVSKRRKPTGQSLRTKLYNKYRPPPRTFTSPNAGNNSPSASTSRTASKNFRTPNDSTNEHDSSSDCSVENYFVNPAELDLNSSFFNVHEKEKNQKDTSPAPVFDCYAGVNLSDSGSEDNKETSGDEKSKKDVFDFHDFLENAKTLERAKETLAKQAMELKSRKSAGDNTTVDMDVTALLALGEKQNTDEEERQQTQQLELGPQKLNKTKSTRIKRHVKTRPTSTVLAGDTDDSDWEEVADNDSSRTDVDSSMYNANKTLEIHVELPSKHGRTKAQKRQEDLELMLKRKLNRDLKERQLLLHKTSLLCHFARSYKYNRLLNDTFLMKIILKLLPSKDSYPTDRGTEISYFQSLITWFKTSVKLKNPVFCLKTKVVNKKKELLQQIQSKEALCKQDLVFMLVILLRGMGIQCRLIVNLQPLPLKPNPSDLLTISLKRNDDKKDVDIPAKKSKTIEKTKEKYRTEPEEKPATKKKSETIGKTKGKDSTEPEIKPTEKKNSETIGKTKVKDSTEPEVKPVEKKKSETIGKAKENQSVQQEIKPVAKKKSETIGKSKEKK